MSVPTLVVANKRYSSWSLRPWLVMTHFALPFHEVGVLLDTPGSKASILAWSPSGRVPCLVDGDIRVWETLAIIEYLAETHPDLPIWPRDRAARAEARAIAAEMHAGFQALRSACPMNLGRRFDWKPRGGAAAAADVARIVDLWRNARTRSAGTGPFLFGEFSAADAMYAPVVTRLDTYSWPLDPDTRAYVDAVLGLPAFRTWKAAADLETATVPSDEVD
jgi:glutathione S-transferase